MRIIAGRFKGHSLVSFQADHIRPTTDRVKGSMFNKLQADLPDARVLDLFSGTGNLAIEALSRDASYVEAVEKNPKSIAILRKNLAKLKIEDEIHVVCQDVLQYLARYAGTAYDLIFVDPPFTEKMADEVMTSLAQSMVLAKHTQVVIESGAHEKIADQYPARDGDVLVRFSKKEFGDKTVSYFQLSTEE